MSIILTEEQKQADREDRITKYKEGFEKLSHDTFIKMKPQITPDGPANVLIDTKEY